MLDYTSLLRGRSDGYGVPTYIFYTMVLLITSGYSVQFYQRAGLTEEDSFNFNLGQYAMGIVGTVGSWFLMPHVGRRTLYIIGLAGMLMLLVIVGGLGTSSNNNVSGYGAGSLLLIYTFLYDITVGPVVSLSYSYQTLPETILLTSIVLFSRR